MYITSNIVVHIHRIFDTMKIVFKYSSIIQISTNTVTTMVSLPIKLFAKNLAFHYKYKIVLQLNEYTFKTSRSSQAVLSQQHFVSPYHYQTSLQSIKIWQSLKTFNVFGQQVFLFHKCHDRTYKSYYINHLTIPDTHRHIQT